MADKKLYSLTDEHKAQIHPWHQRWVKIAMRTTPQTAEDRKIMVDSINGLYGAASLPLPDYVVFGKSPVSCQIAAGIGYYAMEKTQPVNLNVKTDNTVLQAVVKVLRDLLTPEKLIKNTAKAVKVDDTKPNFVRQFVFALFPKLGDEIYDKACEEVKLALNTYSGGNMWSAGVDFISFFRHIVKLDIDYTKWHHYEEASIHGGFRFMYPRFCIVSDFPVKISLDNGNLAHCDDGPSHAWADGFKIYNWHGYLIPTTHHWIIEDKPRMVPDDIAKEQNAELRRIMLEIFGFEKYLEKGNAKVLSEDVDGNGHPRRILQLQVAGETIRVLEVINGSLEADGTRRKFHIGAMPGGTPAEAVAASYGITPKHYKESVRT